MNGTLSHLLAFQTADGAGGAGAMLMNFLPLVLVFVIFYFFIIRPQQKRQKERQAMLDAIKKNDKVVTSGGIHGTVVGIEEKTLLIQIADNVKVKVDRGSVTVISREGEPAPQQ